MNYDIIIIGAGPGGYVAAEKSAKAGFSRKTKYHHRTLRGTMMIHIKVVYA